MLALYHYYFLTTLKFLWPVVQENRMLERQTDEWMDEWIARTYLYSWLNLSAVVIIGLQWASCPFTPGLALSDSISTAVNGCFGQSRGEWPSEGCIESARRGSTQPSMKLWQLASKQTKYGQNSKSGAALLPLIQWAAGQSQVSTTRGISAPVTTVSRDAKSLNNSDRCSAAFPTF